MNWTERVDWIIDCVKWPVACAAIIAFPCSAWALVALLGRALTSPLALLPFLLGLILFWGLWRKWLGRSALGRWLIAFEHELTHAIFAVLTGHSIIGFRASLRKGSEVRFAGKGNWLITSAPYFFPTAALVLSLVAYIMPFSGLPWSGMLLGVALGYHVVSTYRETHGKQTDLQKLGKLFCWMFLPSSNLIVLGFVIALAHGGSSGVNLWYGDLIQPIGTTIRWLWKFSSSSEAGG